MMQQNVSDNNIKRRNTCFVQGFCTSLSNNTYETKDRLYGGNAYSVKTLIQNMQKN